MSKPNRLFVGNLFSEVQSSDLESRFSSYGTVTKVEIKNKKDIDGHIVSTFAFVSINSTDSGVQKCIKDYTNSKWKGKLIKVQLAQESFLSRLQKERDINTIVQNSPVIEARTHKGANYRRVIIEPEITDFGNSIPDGKSDKGIVHFGDSFESSNPKYQRRQYVSSDEDDETNERKSFSNLPLKKGKGFMNKLESFDQECWKDDSESRSSNPNKVPLGTKKTKIESDDRRLFSLKTRQKELQAKKEVVQESLKKSKISKVHKFENSTKEKALELFNEDESDEEDSINFSEKTQFDGPSGGKLLALQSTYGGDKRFQLDSRFEEKSFKKIKETKTSFKDVSKLRFDPLKEKEFILKSSDDEKEDVDVSTIKPNTSGFVHEASQNSAVGYEVNTNLKGSFGSGSTSFSFLNSMGDNLGDKVAVKPYETETIITKKTSMSSLVPNPFKYDSSSEDEEKNECEEKPVTKDESVNFNKLLASTSKENFFFSKEDERFLEGLAFLDIKSTQDEIRARFAEERAELSAIFKKKIRSKTKRKEKTEQGESKNKRFKLNKKKNYVKKRH